MSNTVPDKDLHKLVWCPIVHNDDEASANETLILAASNGRTVSYIIRASGDKGHTHTHTCSYVIHVQLRKNVGT